MPTTTRLSLRYPSTSDTADVPRDIGNLASDIDKAAIFAKGTFAARPTSTVGSPGIDGRYYFATDTSRLYLDTGTSWVEVASGNDSVTAAMIAAGAVDSSELASNAVTTAKITDANVTAAKLAQGAKGLVYLGSASPSGSSTVSFDNVFTSSYTNYRVVYSLSLASGSQPFWIRMRASGSDNTNVEWGAVASYLNVITGAFTSNVTGPAGDSKMLISRVNTNRSGGAFDVHAPQKATYTNITGVTWSSHIPAVVDGTGYYIGGAQASSTQFDGFTLYPTSSTLTGYISVYGYTE